MPRQPVLGIKRSQKKQGRRMRLHYGMPETYANPNRLVGDSEAYRRGIKKEGLGELYLKDMRSTDADKRQESLMRLRDLVLSPLRPVYSGIIPLEEVYQYHNTPTRRRRDLHLRPEAMREYFQNQYFLRNRVIREIIRLTNPHFEPEEKVRAYAQQALKKIIQSNCEWLKNNQKIEEIIRRSLKKLTPNQ